MISAFSGLSAGWLATSWPFVSVMSVHALGGVGAVVVGGDIVAGCAADAENALGLGDDFGDAERLATHAVVADRIDQELRAHEQQQLAEVDLGDEDLAVAA